MEFLRAHLPNPIEAPMELMDLHLGCVMRVDGTQERVVAIMLQPSDALLIEKKVGVLLDDWTAVYEVIGGLQEQGEIAWGPPPDAATRVLLALGMLQGGIHGATRPAVAQMARENQRLQGHLANLRDVLTEVLTESGFEKPAAPLAQCAECGKTSTNDSMWALYCVDCIQATVGPALAEDATLKREAMRKLLDELRTARPLLLCGDQWITAIERVLAMKE